MKQRNAMLAVWTALLVAIGPTLAIVMTPGRPDDDFVISPPPKPTLGSVPFAPWPEAVEVRLFVEDVPWSEQRKTGRWTSRPDGIVLTAAQRAIVDQSVHLYRMTKREANRRAFTDCFIPHHFFRYYDRAGREIGELAVCYCCKGILLEPALRPQSMHEEWQFDFPEVEKMLHEMGVRTDINCGD